MKGFFKITFKIFNSVWYLLYPYRCLCLIFLLFLDKGCSPYLLLFPLILIIFGIYIIIEGLAKLPITKEAINISFVNKTIEMSNITK